MRGWKPLVRLHVSVRFCEEEENAEVVWACLLKEYADSHLFDTCGPLLLVSLRSHPPVRADAMKIEGGDI